MGPGENGLSFDSVLRGNTQFMKDPKTIKDELSFLVITHSLHDEEEAGHITKKVAGEDFLLQGRLRNDEGLDGDEKDNQKAGNFR